jgi:hypothetical protein
VSQPDRSSRSLKTIFARMAVILSVTTLLAGCCFVLWITSMVSQLLRERDCAAMPPPEVFQNVFGQSPPGGVSDILSAGRIWMGGRNVYLRFRATDDAIRYVTRQSRRTVDRKAIQECVESTRMGLQLRGDPRWIPWYARVRWGEVLHIPKPECYSSLPSAPSPTPDVTIIVDRSRHLVYVYLYDI